MSISGCDSFCLDCNKLSTGDHAPSTLIYASLGISAAVGRSYGRAKKREIKMGNTSGTLWAGGGRRLTNARAVIFMIACCLFALFFFFCLLRFANSLSNESNTRFFYKEREKKTC